MFLTIILLLSISTLAFPKNDAQKIASVSKYFSAVLKQFEMKNPTLIVPNNEINTLSMNIKLISAKNQYVRIVTQMETVKSNQFVR